MFQYRNNIWSNQTDEIASKQPSYYHFQANKYLQQTENVIQKVNTNMHHLSQMQRSNTAKSRLPSPIQRTPISARIKLIPNNPLTSMLRRDLTTKLSVECYFEVTGVRRPRGGGRGRSSSLRRCITRRIHNTTPGTRPIKRSLNLCSQIRDILSSLDSSEQFVLQG
jgi:hypothetical protein